MSATLKTCMLFGSSFPFGEPPHDDVEAAAVLLNRHRECGLDDPDFGESFIMMVADPEAVAARAKELRPDLVPLPRPGPDEPDRSELQRLSRLTPHLKKTGHLDDQAIVYLILRARLAARGDRRMMDEVFTERGDHPLVNEILVALAAADQSRS